MILFDETHTHTYKKFQQTFQQSKDPNTSPAPTDMEIQWQLSLSSPTSRQSLLSPSGYLSYWMMNDTHTLLYNQSNIHMNELNSYHYITHKQIKSF